MQQTYVDHPKPYPYLLPLSPRTSYPPGLRSTPPPPARTYPPSPPHRRRLAPPLPASPLRATAVASPVPVPHRRRCARGGCGLLLHGAFGEEHGEGASSSMARCGQIRPTASPPQRGGPVRSRGGQSDSGIWSSGGGRRRVWCASPPSPSLTDGGDETRRDTTRTAGGLFPHRRRV